MNARWLVVVGIAGCGGSDPTETVPAETVVLTDENNYSYEAELTLTSTELMAGNVNTVDWSGITVDYRGRGLAPSEVDRVTIASMSMDAATLIDKIDRDELTQEDVADYREHLNTSGATSAPFDAFAVIEAPFHPETEFLEDDSQTWLVTLWSLNERDVYEILSSQLVVPRDDSPNTVLPWTNDVATLAVDADLSTAPAAVTVPGEDRYALNWATVELDVHGAPFDEYYADTLRIAHFDATDVAQIEAAFLQLDVAAAETWYADVWTLRSLGDLSAATTLDGAAFPGFSEDGTWIVSLECTDDACFSPAPKYLAVVAVDGA
jgi:hypothetical protein